MSDLIPKPDGYAALLLELKQRIQTARLKASLAVNHEMMMLYWSIGNDILARQEEKGWGAKVIDQLSNDLRAAFPGQKGLSGRNLKYMRKLASEWPDQAIVPQLVAQIPWGHNRVIIEQLKDRAEREWYIRQTIENGWSRNVLQIQIDRDLYSSKGKALTNFARTLPAADSDLAQQTLNDPVKLDFLGLTEAAKERDIHEGLIQHLRRFLLELGWGFALLGDHYPIKVGGDDFEIDLLFYHVILRRYVVLEIKARDFKPTDVGQLGFYVEAVNRLMRHSDDGDTLGFLLCRGKNDAVVDFTLSGTTKPMAVSEYQLTKHSLPDELEGKVPSIDVLRQELQSFADQTSETDDEDLPE